MLLVLLIVVGAMATKTSAVWVEKLIPHYSHSIRLSSSQGSFWDGQGDLYKGGHHLGRLSWEIILPSLATGIPWFNYSLVKLQENTNTLALYSIKGKAKINGQALELQKTKASVETNFLVQAALGEDSYIETTGQLTLTGSLQWQLSSVASAGIIWHAPSQADATIRWPDGQFTVILGFSRLSQENPGLEGKLTSENNSLQLAIYTIEDNIALGTLALTPEGSLQVQAYYAILDVVELPFRRSDAAKGELLSATVVDISSYLP